MKPRYLGDSVYVQFNGHQVEIRTATIHDFDVVIYLNEKVCNALAHYLAEVKAVKATANKPNE